jgi:hypothetical protein
MGLFSSDEPSEEVKNLVKGAEHQSVDAEVLGETSSSGLGANDYLNDGPLVDHLHHGEQPHYILTMSDVAGCGVFVDDGEDLLPDKNLRDMVAVTNERILIVVGKKSGDRHFVIDYSDICSISLNSEESHHPESVILRIGTEQLEYEFRTLDLAEANEQKFKEAGQYIADMTD